VVESLMGILALDLTFRGVNKILLASASGKKAVSISLAMETAREIVPPSGVISSSPGKIFIFGTSLQ